MTLRSQQPTMPIQGVYFLLTDLAKQQGHPLVLNEAYKKDTLQKFFDALVKDGVATYRKKISFFQRLKIALTWRDPV